MLRVLKRLCEAVDTFGYRLGCWLASFDLGPGSQASMIAMLESQATAKGRIAAIQTAVTLGMPMATVLGLLHHVRPLAEHEERLKFGAWLDGILSSESGEERRAA